MSIPIHSVSNHTPRVSQLKERNAVVAHQVTMPRQKTPIVGMGNGVFVPLRIYAQFAATRAN